MDKKLKIMILDFLYDQVKQNKIPQIKKGMVEDLEEFVSKVLAFQETEVSASRMIKKAEESNEENSKS